MSQQIYTIVITDGAFQGASQHTDRGEAVPLDLSALGKILPKINAAAIATNASIAAAKDAEIAALNDYIARVAAAKAAIVEAIKNPEVDTEPAIIAIMAEAEKPETEKRKEALAAEIAAKQAELETLE